MAALPLWVRRKSRSGASRFRAHAVRPDNERVLFTASSVAAGSIGMSAPVTESPA